MRPVVIGLNLEARRIMLLDVNRILRNAVVLTFLIVLPAVLVSILHAQTSSLSAAPPAQPASWFNQQTKELGLAGFDDATTITPEGYLRTGFEELMFFSGPDLDPTNIGCHIFKQSGLPVVHYEFNRDGIDYRFTIFAGKIDKAAIVRARQLAKFPFMPGFDIESGIIEPQIDFVRVDMTNRARDQRRAVFASGVRYGDHPAVSGRSPDGEAFNRSWRNYFDGVNFYRFSRDLYSFPSGYVDRSFTVRKNWSEPNPEYVLTETLISPAVTPATPIGIVTYARQLSPGESWHLDFKLPVIPTADSFVISAIDNAELGAIEAQVHGKPDAQR